MNYVELEWRWAMVLGAALGAGLVEAVAGERKTADGLAVELGLDRRAVYTVMSALSELGVLDEAGEGYLLREGHRGPLLDVESPGYAGGRVLHRFEVMAKWATLPGILLSGRPAEDRTVPRFAGTETTARAMRAGSRESAEEVSALVLSRLPETPRILDVGGGSGANAESFARNGASVTVLDRPEVFEVNGGFLAGLGIKLVSGDMNVALPEGPFDGVYLGNTSHMYGPDENRALFAKMYEALAPGGCVVVREFVRGLYGDVAGEAALFAVNMLVLTSRGGTYTTGEYRGWLEEAGLSDVEFLPIAGRTTALIFARRPPPEG